MATVDLDYNLGLSSDQDPRRRNGLGEVEEVGAWLGFTIFSLCLSRSFCPLLTECFELKNNAQRAWNEYKGLLRDQIALEESTKETTRFCGEASMKIPVSSSLR